MDFPGLPTGSGPWWGPGRGSLPPHRQHNPHPRSRGGPMAMPRHDPSGPEEDRSGIASLEATGYWESMHEHSCIQPCSLPVGMEGDTASRCHAGKTRNPEVVPERRCKKREWVPLPHLSRRPYQGLQPSCRPLPSALLHGPTGNISSPSQDPAGPYGSTSRMTLPPQRALWRSSRGEAAP
jgi:hypothetical protein